MTTVHHTIKPEKSLTFNQWAVYIRSELNKIKEASVREKNT